MIPPGGEGGITLVVKTESFQGPIRKTTYVYTNDPAQKQVSLVMKGTVKARIYIKPQRVRLYGVEGKILSSEVTIEAGLDQPLELTPLQFNLEDKVTYAIETVEPGRKFKIRFTALNSTPQKFKGILKLKTNYAERPQLVINVDGRIQRKRSPSPKPALPPGTTLPNPTPSGGQ